jgi:hypothetical protein
MPVKGCKLAGASERRQWSVVMNGDLIKWSFVFWVGAVGAIAMLAGVLR